MTAIFAALWGLITNLPTILKIVTALWEFVGKISNGDRTRLLTDVARTMEELNAAKTHEERSLVARKLSDIWGLRDPNAPKA